MKKIFLFFILLFGIFYTGCKNNESTNDEKTIIDIEFVDEVYEYEVYEFNINDISFNIIYNDQSKETKELNEDMINAADLGKLSEHGTHEISVLYNGISKKITINLIKKYTVIFKLDDEILHEEKVELGKSANPPKKC